jgi:hypothetical protein
LSTKYDQHETDGGFKMWDENEFDYEVIDNNQVDKDEANHEFSALENLGNKILDYTGVVSFANSLYPDQIDVNEAQEFVDKDLDQEFVSE